MGTKVQTHVSLRLFIVIFLWVMTMHFQATIPGRESARPSRRWIKALLGIRPHWMRGHRFAHQEEPADRRAHFQLALHCAPRVPLAAYG